MPTPHRAASCLTKQVVEELNNRLLLLKRGVRRCKRINLQDKECERCRCPLFYSALSCRSCSSGPVCLNHADSVCSCGVNSESSFLLYKMSVAELEFCRDSAWTRANVSPSVHFSASRSLHSSFFSPSPLPPCWWVQASKAAVKKARESIEGSKFADIETLPWADVSQHLSDSRYYLKWKALAEEWSASAYDVLDSKERSVNVIRDLIREGEPFIIGDKSIAHTASLWSALKDLKRNIICDKGRLGKKDGDLPAIPYHPSGLLM